MSIEPLDDAYDEDTWPWILDPSVQTYPPHPVTDRDSAWALAKAVTELAVIRCPALGMGDALADLHASVSLVRQGWIFVREAVSDARAQERSWTEIAAQLETSPAAAQRRYRRR